MLSGRWQMAIEALRASLPRWSGYAGACLFLANLRGHQHRRRRHAVIGHLPKSYRAGEDFHYGLRLTTRLVARDNIGYPIRIPLDNLSSVHIAVRNAATFAYVAAGLREWSVCLYFYKVVKH